MVSVVSGPRFLPLYDADNSVCTWFSVKGQVLPTISVVPLAVRKNSYWFSVYSPTDIVMEIQCVSMKEPDFKVT
jgi:hypothetical protein